jgi:hypothetical protein
MLEWRISSHGAGHISRRAALHLPHPDNLVSCREPSWDASKAFLFRRPRAGAPGLQVGRKKLLRAMYRYVFIPTARCAPRQGQRSSQAARIVLKIWSCALSTAFDPYCPCSPAHCDDAQGEPRSGQGPARWLQEGAEPYKQAQPLNISHTSRHATGLWVVAGSLFVRLPHRLKPIGR